jgi:imidazole glycerol-phosphate synthase subunit HisH
MNISIINSGFGNIASLKNMLIFLGYKPVVCDHVEGLKKSDFIFLPGVGSFDNAVKNLKQKNFYEYLKEKKNFENSTLIGICVGMQLLFEESEEGTEKGLNLLNGKIKKFSTNNLKIPHMGWNSVFGDNFYKSCNEKRFYFAHSYHVVCDNNIIVAKCEYGEEIPVYVKKDNVHGIQFHPEKSHKNGMKLLNSILDLDYTC